MIHPVEPLQPFSLPDYPQFSRLAKNLLYSPAPLLTIAPETSRLIDLSPFARRGDRMGEESAR